MTIPQSLQAAHQHYRAGEFAAAETICRQALIQMPDQPDALNLLGLLMLCFNQLPVALELFTKAVKNAPTVADFQGNHGLALALNGKIDAAIAAFHRALKIRPAFPAALCNLADALCITSHWPEAIAAYEEAAALRPLDAEASRNLASALVHTRQWDKSILSCRAAIAMQPNHPAVYNTLGLALQGIGQPDQAQAAFQQAVKLNPDFVDAMNNLANIYSETAQPRRAMECRDQSIAINPTRADSASNRLYAMYFDPDCDPAAILHEHKLWDSRYAEPLRQTIRPHNNDRSPNRPLRIGYVFPNIHSHPAFIPPLLLNHDRERIKIYCYSDLIRDDPATARLQKHADAWRMTPRLRDAQLAEQVRADEIDILVDLVMHMSGSRLLAFAQKPAPIQVTWLAYPGTTGLATMDYRLTDFYLDPPGRHDDWYTEKSIRLSPTFACYDPTCGMGAAIDDTPMVAPLPAQSNGYITFGGLNHMYKVNDGVLKLWCRVMMAAPGSRLRLLAEPGEARQRVLQRMNDFGVAANRIDFVGRQKRPDYLAEYGRIDLCLDTLPYCGHTTTLDSIWMGAPVVTRVGTTAAGRAGWSVLNNLQLTELAAQTDDDFVRIATGLAGDLPRLAELRRTLRRRLLDSPIMDAPAFAKNVEAAFADMWKNWTQTP
jgi:predicted O-linked N-acetylglucosamine transferase (SPINDLY family)